MAYRSVVAVVLPNRDQDQHIELSEMRNENCGNVFFGPECQQQRSLEMVAFDRTDLNYIDVFMTLNDHNRMSLIVFVLYRLELHIPT